MKRPPVSAAVSALSAAFVLAVACTTAAPVSASQLGNDASAAEKTPCARGMVLVEGDYCTEVRQACVAWVDPPQSPLARCAKFAPTECTGQKVHKRFCIDRDEYVAPGETLPEGDLSWIEAKALCDGQHKRLCRETEWELACEGEQMFPYPTGYERDAKACNFDKNNLVDARTGKLRDQRQPASALEHCVSPYGVRNMTGNVDEWVLRDRTWGEWRSALKGGWWMAARDRCRPATTAHDEHFHELPSGARCCADPE
jgi:formylglycine-generating enzyme required for sulfatase activity